VVLRKALVDTRATGCKTQQLNMGWDLVYKPVRIKITDAWLVMLCGSLGWRVILPQYCGWKKSLLPNLSRTNPHGIPT
jgi:hypothetical protein